MILFILGGALMLGLCIFIHELGHYSFGRLLGVKAEIFSIGYGKGRWKKKIGDTTWQVTAIPLGGYVKFYGDDSPEQKVPGSLNSLPPLRRMIPVLGGPLFNLFLAAVILILLHTFSGPLAPRVVLVEEESNNSAAKRSGLRNGDLVLAIDGKPLHSFMELSQQVALSGARPLEFLIERKGKKITKTVEPDLLPSGISSLGLRMPGERYLKVNYPFFSLWSYRARSLLGDKTPPREMRAMEYLKDGDIILSVEGRPIKTPGDLQKILGQSKRRNVSARLERERYPWLAPWPKYEKTLQVPTYSEYILDLTNIIDRKYKRPVSEQLLYSAIPEHQLALNFIKINGKAPGSFQSLTRKFAQEKAVRIEMDGRFFQARAKAERLGLMGFRPTSLIRGDYANSHPSVLVSLREAFRDLVNNIMVYPAFFKGLFTGRISFFDNAAGPVRIFGVAGIVLQSGFQNYLHLFAAISIALFIMNLLPFPVVDGGHLVFFLYEALMGKPLSLKIRETLHRLGFGALLFVGIWIMYKDLLWFIGL